ncbi:MAG: ferredoxin [Elusimicrobia bacterium]|nr:ferredoxin [Elusimicrobiota bacterium]
MNGGRNMGSAGFCVCYKCGYRENHRQGERCRDKICPHCGIALVREGGYHYNIIMEAKKKGKEKGG